MFQPRRVLLKAAGFSRRAYRSEQGFHVLDGSVDTHSAEFRGNAAEMERLVEQLRARTSAVRRGGGEAAVAKHTSRGKLFVRERIERLLDPGTPFLEFSTLAANGE
jgi:3-methylcrotonyl-CoA carboxylase beta subunit